VAAQCDLSVFYDPVPVKVISAVRIALWTYHKDSAK